MRGKIKITIECVIAVDTEDYPKSVKTMEDAAKFEAKMLKNGGVCIADYLHEEAEATFAAVPGFPEPKKKKKK
jgi:hypothetical protein